EFELPPNLIVARDASVGDSGPARSVPVLDRKIRNPFVAKGGGLGRFGSACVIILQRNNIYLVDHLASAKLDLKPIRIGTNGCVVPPAGAAPVFARTITVYSSPSRIGTAVFR